MGIKAAYMVPHPPLIVPDIGRGGEDQILPTTRSYEKIAQDIADISPDTIVVISPHSVMYSDYFHISPGDRAEGDFRRFGAPQVSFAESYDVEFRTVLTDLLVKDCFPGGTSGERDSALDHGTMVPLYFIRRYCNTGKIIRIGLSGLPLTDHYRLGMYIKKASEMLCRSTVIVASGDLSHKLKESGPYGFDPAGPLYDKMIMESAAKCDFEGMLKYNEDLLDKAAECGHRSFVIMAGAFDGMDVKSEVLSHQDATGVGYGVCIFRPVREDEDRRILIKTDMEHSAYVRLARETIVKYVASGKILRFPDDLTDELRSDLPKDAFDFRAGAFVSVHKNGMLRGCIGTISAVRRSIGEEIVYNAVSAVSRDPRFEPVSKEELSSLEIKVDILGEAEDISSTDLLDVKRYGVIVTCGYKRGLLLPDLEGVDTVEEQVSIAMAKGGILPSDPYTLQRFEVVRYT